MKHALAQYSVTPTLDFGLDASIQHSTAVSQPFTAEKQFSASGSSLYKTFTQKNQAHFINNKSDLEYWNASFPEVQKAIHEKRDTSVLQNEIQKPADSFPSYLKDVTQVKINKKPSSEEFIQVHKSFVIAENENGFIVIHQQNAHERILYERFVNAMKGKPIAIQRSLFPVTLELTPADAVLMNVLLTDLNLLGYQVEPFGNNPFVIQCSPAELPDGNDKASI